MDEKIDEISFFEEATLHICGSLDLERALWRTFTFLRRSIPMDAAYLGDIRAGHSVERILAEARPDGGRLLKVVIPVSPEGLAFAESRPPGEVVVVNDPQDNPVARDVIAFLGTDDFSLLVLQLVTDGRKIGAVHFLAYGRGRYTEQHARRIGRLAAPFTIALCNYQRYEQVELLREQLADDNRYLMAELRHLGPSVEVVGADSGLRHVMQLTRQVAPTSSPVLLLGETGVGKEVVAAAIHHLSPRQDGPYIKVNCGAIPPGLLDSELFGHEKGAFTGALSRRRGRFERAHGGTLFLDEIGELPAEAQVRLLRALQDKEIERVGSTEATRVDVRIIAATHRDLEAMVRDGRFREDLYFRLQVFPIAIPPLRQRKADIPALVRHFIGNKARQLGLVGDHVPAPGALEQLQAYDWPGNVRELENVIERALILCRGRPLTFDQVLPRAAHPAPGPAASGGEVLALDELVARHIRRVLERAGGRVEGEGGAAALLRVNPSTLRKRMRKLGIRFGRAGATKT